MTAEARTSYPRSGGLHVPRSGSAARAAWRYRLRMTNYVCRYPDGAAGLGLLLLRICHAPVALGLAALAIAWDPHVRFSAAGLIALLLVAGLATRLAALLLGIAAVVALSTSSPVD